MDNRTVDAENEPKNKDLSTSNVNKSFKNFAHSMTVTLQYSRRFFDKE